MFEPTRESVEQAMSQFDPENEQVFLERVEARSPRSQYLSHEGTLYPLKALWASAHRPPIRSADTRPDAARRGLRALGFDNFVESSLAEQYDEGRRTIREVSVLSRSAKLVDQAKSRHGLDCKVCGFNFEAKYGELGAGYIECHHLDPLSGRDGRDEPTSIDDVTVLCANCHRMIHRRNPALTLDELISARATARMAW